MVDKLKKKLNSRSGESLTETLVALLISALALVMLAGAITASMRVITRSREKLDEYYNANESVVAGGTQPGKVSISVAGIQSKDYDVYFSTNDEFSNTPVISYKYTGH
jgi:hypothetical protein